MSVAPIVALAGRRIDPPDADSPRFPLRNASVVRDRLLALLTDSRAATVVSSAACGADLLALEVAGSLGLRRRIVLPFERRRFRVKSVIDRPGEWGTLFDEVMNAVEKAGDVIVLRGADGDDAAYAIANEAILEEATRLAQEGVSSHQSHQRGAWSDSLLAVVVWDGKSRGEGDLTAAFAGAARARGVRVLEVLTTDPS